MSSRIVDAAGVTPSDLVILDGIGMGVEDVVRLADGAARPVPGTDGMRRAEESWNAARQIAATGRVYGRSTGVGANRNEDVPTEAAAGHGLRLLRSHAGAIGEELPARQVRAMLAVRANRNQPRAVMRTGSGSGASRVLNAVAVGRWGHA
ncbi:aromatic amino acid lyase, partial [Streptomyces sp. NPDC048279]|uniref:aromatic amino acid lyase n=1 Tax=Streptomyces sp. NPDC048279 TaxID=3154714 RepID=UPI0034149209